MDNLTYRISNVGFDVPSLLVALKSKDINVTQKTIPRTQTETILFSLPVGKYAARWLFRINLKDGSISCSGGVTKTFFGHNVWVFKNEATQLAAILLIIHVDLQNIHGIRLPPVADSVSIERAEITHHFEMQAPVTKAGAIAKLNTLFMTLFPARRFLNGDTHDEPGTTGIGVVKSSRVCRAYDPRYKFDEKPEHISEEPWVELKKYCVNHLRIELMFSKRELIAAGLSTVAGWNDSSKIEQLVAKRYRDYGLSVEFTATNTGFTPADVKKTNPSYVDFARHWFSAGAKGTPPSGTSGSANRFKTYMARKGFRTEVPFNRHIYLQHGLHDILQPGLSADLPDAIRQSRELFGQWWRQIDA